MFKIAGYVVDTRTMPTASEVDGLVTASLITGPKHVWLGIRVGQPQGDVVFVERPAIGKCKHGSINHEILHAAVLAGFAMREAL